MSPTIAEAKKPPADDLPPTTGGQSAGSRGCGLDSKGLQQVIPPLDKAQTNSTTPTLAWHHNSLETSALEFRIFKYDSTTQQSEIIAEVLNPAIQKLNHLSILSWPDQLPPLTPNTQYIWQVEVVCDPNRPSGNIFADAPLRTLPTAQAISSSALRAQELHPQTGAYDLLAMVLHSNIDVSFQRYFLSLQDQTEINSSWNQLIGSLRVTPLPSD